MKRRAAIVLFLSLLAAAGSGLWLVRMRRPAAAASDAPWVRYVMVGLGGFRGLAAEALWLRASALQSEGRYFELVQLSNWINALDPKAVEAWVFNSWNMAYNICAMVPGGEAKLRWVKAAQSLLRDRAIGANPASGTLYRELGWLFQNKIGSRDDPAHLVYKIDLARRASRVLAGEECDLEMDADIRSEIESAIGKIDWRMAHAHSLYWAWKGLKAHKGGLFEEEALRRMVRQSLCELVLHGKFAGDAEKGIYAEEPDYGLLEGVIAYYGGGALGGKPEARAFAAFLESLAARLGREGHDGLALKAEEGRRGVLLRWGLATEQNAQRQKREDLP